MSEVLELMEKLKREIEVGGELNSLPCPKCGLPRSQRSGLHPVQPLRVELASGGGRVKESAVEQGAVPVKCVQPGHTVFKNGAGWYCMTCDKVKI